MKLKHIITGFLLLNIIISLGQENNGEQDLYAGEVSKMINIPNSPEAQAFAKYGDTQVNMFAGTPQISIPLHVIEGRELNLPLTLTYDASGVAVEQKATWVGLSWNLNVGGRISRTTNGLPDDYYERGNNINEGFAYMTMFNDRPGFGFESVASKTKRYLDKYVGKETPEFDDQADAIAYYEFLNDINKNNVDAQPDYFTLNVMGINETIVFTRVDNENIPIVLNNPRIKIEPVYGSFQSRNNGPLLDYILSWKIIGEDGTQYFFDEVEETIRTNGMDNNAFGDLGTTKYSSSWVLTKIISKNRKDTYEFGYTGNVFETQEHLPSSSSSATLAIEHDDPDYNYPPQNSEDFIGAVTSQINQKYLSTIMHNGQLMAQTILGTRYDVQPNVANTRLESIDFYDFSGGDLKSIVFDNTDYFNIDSADPPNLSASGKTNADVRLKLDGLQIKGKDQVSYQNYHFDYIKPDILPSRHSMDQDYLGYYNGAGNTTMYPEYKSGSITFPGANREPNCEFSMIGLLNQVTYPTGGRTVYTYESHDEFRSNSMSGLQAVHSFNVSASTNVDSDLFLDENGDQCEDVNPLPKIVIKTFRIEEAKSYIMDYVGSGSTSAIIVDPSLGQKNFTTYCDFQSAGGYIVWQSGNSGTTNLNLGGKYVIMLRSDFGANGYDDAFLSIKEEYSENTSFNANVGGHRIAKITDYTKESEVAMTKFYTYEKDGKSTGSENFLPRNLAEIPVFTSVQGSESINNQRLVRYASAPRGSEPYMVYSSVKEYKIDGSGSSLGHTTYDFFGGKKGVSPRLTAPYENSYTSNIKSGNVQSKTVFDQEGNLVAKDSIAFFENDLTPARVSGIVVFTREENFDKVIMLEARNVGTGSYYVAPVYLDAFYDCTGISGGGGKLGHNCPVPPYMNALSGNGFDYLARLNMEYSALGTRKTLASDRYGGVSTAKTETVYIDSNNNTISVVSEEETEYDESIDGYYLPKKKRITDSKSDVYETEYTYAFELTGAVYDSLVSNNNLVEAVKTRSIKNPNSEAELLSARENQYSIFPLTNEAIVLPTTITTQKGADANSGGDDRVIFDFYSDGNLKSAKRTIGPTTVYVWGYDRRYPVVKIENTTVAQVQTILGLDANLDLGAANHLTAAQETALRTGLTNAMVSTYSYLPSVGVSSMTDPRGYTINYEYDDFNRLEAVRDADGNLVTDYEYGYKQIATNQ